MATTASTLKTAESQSTAPGRNQSASENAIRYGQVASPIGELLLLKEGGALSGLYILGRPHSPAPSPAWIRDQAAFEDARAQLGEYFEGERQEFDLPLRLSGSSFQLSVWNALLEIPYGERASYGEIAERIQRPRAARGVGAACGSNAISIVIPCHRVVASGGGLGGYGWGLERKSWLLDLEQHRFQMPF